LTQSDNLDLALPRIPLTAKPLTENQITYLAKRFACFGPDAIEAVRDLEVDAIWRTLGPRVEAMVAGK